MKIYLLSLGAGLLVGIVYSLLNVRSPAPPVIALVGLLGILVGEQIIPLAKTLWEQGAGSRLMASSDQAARVSVTYPRAAIVSTLLIAQTAKSRSGADDDASNLPWRSIKPGVFEPLLTGESRRSQPDPSRHHASRPDPS